MLQLNKQTKFPSVFLRPRSLVGCLQSCNMHFYLTLHTQPTSLFMSFVWWQWWNWCHNNNDNQQNTGWWDLFDVRAYHVNVFNVDVKYFLNVKQVFTVQTTHLAQLMPSKANLPWFIFSESYSQSVLSMTTHQGVAVREPEIC